MANKGLSLYEFSDRELLHLVDDHTVDAEDGRISAAELQKVLKLSSKNPHSNIGVRFAWMRSFGLMEKEGNRWSLTPTGRKIKDMKLTAAQTKTLKGLSPAAGMEAMLALGDMYSSLQSKPEGIVMRRAWRYKSGARS